jgi:ferritin-like metal-binding protein YciE
MSKSALRQLLLDGIKDLYNAETQLTKALPKLAKAASHSDLKSGLQQHLLQTEIHVERLEKIFKHLGALVRGKMCPAMRGLIAEANEIVTEHEAGPIRDAAIIGAAQRVEHYEIAAYGTVRTFAEQLGLKQIATLLQMTLDEEAAADKKLTGVALLVNSEALALDD